MAFVRRKNGKHWDKRQSRGRRGPEKSTRQSDHGANERTTRVVPPSRELKRLLEGIGTPRPTPFKPDPFQLEALAALEYEDVLVTAPTGSGKTWIAREEIRRLLDTGRRAWYTSPLKALTNSKYQEFIDEFGADRVGILTGDRKENSDAPLIVGTTEIYRNQLFDSLRGGSEVSADLVVLDEAHYLADEDRGHVWEEAIILTPPRIRLLLLSATIGNAHEFAVWLEEVRGVRCGVISGPLKRPVPLRAAVLLPDRRLLPLLNESGNLNPEIVKLAADERRSDRR
jgi:superfamily II RNA helicase